MAVTGLRRRRALLVLAVSMSSGCVLDADAKRACMTQDDCVDGFTCLRGLCESDATWGCLAGAPFGSPTDEPIALSLLVLDEGTEAPVAGAIVRVCLRSDVACAAPTVEATTGPRGTVDLELADEYLEVLAPGYRNTIAMGASSLEVTTGGVSPLSVHFDLFSSAGFASLASGTGVEPRADRADIEVLSRDCAYESVAGVKLELDVGDSTTVRRYLVNDLPSLTAVETDVSSGSAIFFNAPPGLRSVGGVIAATGQPISDGGSPQAVIARAGWLSHVAIAPPGVRITDARGD